VLNKHLWRRQLAGLSDIRRCIAVDLLVYGDTEITPDQDVSVTANAKMLKEVLGSSQRSIPSGCGRCPSPTAIPMTTGRRRQADRI
jgi:hypothetical protein